MAVTFETLNPEAPIFGELSDDAPSWWNRFKSDPSLYIEIRKDNQVNVYPLSNSNEWTMGVCYARQMKLLRL